MNKYNNEYSYKNSKYNLELLRDSINSKIINVLSKLDIINTKKIS